MRRSHPPRSSATLTNFEVILLAPPRQFAAVAFATGFMLDRLKVTRESTRGRRGDGIIVLKVCPTSSSLLAIILPSIPSLWQGGAPGGPRKHGMDSLWRDAICNPFRFDPRQGKKARQCTQASARRAMARQGIAGKCKLARHATTSNETILSVAFAARSINTGHYNSLNRKRIT